MTLPFRRLVVFAAIALGVLQAATNLQATVYHVKSSGNDSNDGKTWGTSVKTLKQALKLATGASDEIWLASGSYGDITTDNNTDPLATDEKANSMFTVSQAINIYGGFNGTEASPDDRSWSGNKYSGHPSATTTIRGSNAIRPLYLEANVRLDGLTITGGSNVAGNGGGVFVKKSATFWKCKIQSNSTTGSGGGIYVKSGTVHFVWNQVTSNTASANGGGVLADVGTTFKAYNSTFQSNTAFDQGAGQFATAFFYGCLFKSSSTTGGTIAKSVEVGAGQFHYCTIQDFSSTSYVVYSSADPVYKGCLYAADPVRLKAMKDNSGQLQNDNLQGSATTSAVSSDALPADYHDFDNDGNTGESMPVDLNGKVRNDDSSTSGDNHGATSKEAAAFTTFTITVSGNSSSPLFDEDDWDGIKVGSSATTLKIFEAQIGETPLLKANPPEHWNFDYWNGDPSSTGNLTLSAVSAPVNVTATFSPVDYTVNLQPTKTELDVNGVPFDVSLNFPNGESGPASINGGDLNVTTGNYPDTVQIIVEEVTGFRLRDWLIVKDGGSEIKATESAEFNATSPLTLTYEANWSITPVFTAAVYDLTLEDPVTNYSSDTGSYLGSPSGFLFQKDDEVTITFTPSSGHQLSHITMTNKAGQEVNATDLLDGSGFNPVVDKDNRTLKFTVGGDLGYDLRIKGYFEPISFAINVTTAYGGDVTPGDVYLDADAVTVFAGEDPLPNGKYKEGTVLKLEAKVLAEPNKIRVLWQHGITTSDENPYYLGVDEDLDITVTFSVDRYNLTQRVFFGEDDSTFVELLAKYPYGEEVNSTIGFDTAGFDYNGSFYADGRPAPSSFTMKENILVNIRFLPKVHAVTAVAMTPDVNGTLVPGGGVVDLPFLVDFKHGQEIELEADPDPAFQFDRWEWTEEGVPVQSRINPRTWTVNEALALTAVFVPRQYKFDFFSEPRTGGSWFVNSVNFADGSNAIFEHNASLEIQAAPSPGFDLNGSISMVDPDGKVLSYETAFGNNKKIILNVDSNATVSAVFSKDYKDSDGDGLTNYEESLHGSDPYQIDTDGDSIDDKWEVTWGLNPVDPLDRDDDYDYDGLENWKEYDSGTYPRNPDSDGDSYVDVWIPKDTSGSTLLAGYSLVRIEVVPFGAGIVRGEGAYENNSTATITLQEATPGYVFVNWQGDLSGDENNGTVLIDGNKTIIANFAFDNTDSDGDGIDNYTESLYGTDANKIDTDDDGINDDVEIAAQTHVTDLNVSGVFDPIRSDASFFSYLDTLGVTSGSIGSGGSSSGSGGTSATGSGLLYDFINGWFYTDPYGWSFATSNTDSIYNSRASTWLSFQKNGSNALQLYKWDYPSKQWVDYASAAVSGQYNLTVTKNLNAGGEVSSGGTFASGTAITITAKPNAGYHFIGWEGDVVSSSATESFVLDKNIAVQAVFLTDDELSNLLDGSQGN